MVKAVYKRLNENHSDCFPGSLSVNRRKALVQPMHQGEVLLVATRSFGSVGVFAIPEMGRFYRHVLIGGGYPHHGAVAFGHHGKSIFEV